METKEMVLRTYTATLAKESKWKASDALPDDARWTLYAIQAGAHLSEPLRGFARKPLFTQLCFSTYFGKIFSVSLFGLKEPLLLPPTLPPIFGGERFAFELVEMPEDIEGEVYVHLLYLCERTGRPRL